MDSGSFTLTPNPAFAGFTTNSMSSNTSTENSNSLFYDSTLSTNFLSNSINLLIPTSSKTSSNNCFAPVVLKQHVEVNFTKLSNGNVSGCDIVEHASPLSDLKLLSPRVKLRNAQLSNQSNYKKYLLILPPFSFIHVLRFL